MKLLLTLSTLMIILTLGLISCTCPDQTTQEKNKELARMVLEEGINKQNMDLFGSMLTEDFVRHCQSMPPEMQEIKGIEQMKAFLASNYVAFPDWNEEITLMIAEGDLVAIITRGTGTNSGPMGETPATNKKVDLVEFIVQRFENGKIAEAWVGWDNVAILSQMGLYPPPPPPSSEG